MPVLRGCATCGTPFVPRHARHRWCPIHEPRGNAERSPTTRSRPSSSAERERIRALVLEDGAECALQLPGCEGLAAGVDHIIPAAEGGAYALDNLRPACHRCNSVRGRAQQTATLRHGRADRSGGPPVPGDGVPRPVGSTRLA